MIKPIINENFSQLLQRFSANQDEASIAYTKLHDSLVRFFALKGDFEPETAADETIDRVALKLSQNGEIDDLTKYSFGVARFIFLERLRIAQKEKLAAEGYHSEKQFQPVEETDEFAVFRECYGKVSDDEQTLLKDYFADLPQSRLVEQRQKLIEKYGISLNNLRLKIFRLRQRLEDCVKSKLR